MVPNNKYGRRCLMCGSDIAGLHGVRKVCGRCCVNHDKEGRKAIACVAKAIARGQLPPATAHRCVDCGTPATAYDHRDYTEPLNVAPVCRSCNGKRGHAFNSFYRPESAGEFSKVPLRAAFPAGLVLAGFSVRGDALHGTHRPFFASRRLYVAVRESRKDAERVIHAA